MDVLFTSSIWRNDKIAWYESTDGLETFGRQQVIASDVGGPQSICTADLDGDADLDVLVPSRWGRDKIALYENTDGLGDFGRQQVITTEVVDAFSVYAEDLDGDGDLDVLSASAGDDKIAWYENRICGDANDDGVFDSSDLVCVFQAGEYEDQIPDNSTFEEGDWNSDGDFTSSDLVFAFQCGNYVAAALPNHADVVVAAARQITAGYRPVQGTPKVNPSRTIHHAMKKIAQPQPVEVKLLDAVFAQFHDEDDLGRFTGPAVDGQRFYPAAA